MRPRRPSRPRASTDALARVETEYLGKRSDLTRAHRALGGLDPEARREAGRRLNEVRARLEGQLAGRREQLAEGERSAALAADRLDLTEVIPAQVRSASARGHLHLVTTARAELEDVFVGMGFTVAEGPEAESDWYNFEALNIPPAHPARGMYDTMYLDVGEPETVLLRTHTSPVQIHLMEEAVRRGTLPIHAVMPGKCFRLDTPDARHLPVFNQIEGLVVDRGITFGDLAGTIQSFTEAYFGAGMQSRLRPAYFPFTEPSAEYEITCTVCLGEGCRTCSHTGWIELGRLRHGRPGGVRRRRDRHRRLVRLRLRVRHRPPGPDASRHSGHALVPGERHSLPHAVLTRPTHTRIPLARSTQLAP